MVLVVSKVEDLRVRPHSAAAQVEPTPTPRSILVDRHLQEMFVRADGKFETASDVDLYSPLEIVRRVFQAPSHFWARESYRPMLTELNQYLQDRGLKPLYEDSPVVGLGLAQYAALRGYLINCGRALDSRTEQEWTEWTFAGRRGGAVGGEG